MHLKMSFAKCKSFCLSLNVIKMIVCLLCIQPNQIIEINTKHIHKSLQCLWWKNSALHLWLVYTKQQTKYRLLKLKLFSLAQI